LHGAAAEVFDPKFISDFSQLEGHVDFLYAVTAVMARLQSRQPLSHPPEAYDGGLLDAHPPWPTPTASQWAEIQTVALRVMVLLEWCTEELALSEHTTEETWDLVALKQALVLLLHQLLLAHMQNPKLSMDRVFRYEPSQVSAQAARLFFALICHNETAARTHCSEMHMTACPIYCREKVRVKAVLICSWLGACPALAF